MHCTYPQYISYNPWILHGLKSHTYVLWLCTYRYLHWCIHDLSLEHMGIWVPSQYKDFRSKYGYFHYKDKTAVSLGMDNSFHHTLYWAYDYFSMLGLKLKPVSKRDPRPKCVIWSKIIHEIWEKGILSTTFKRVRVPDEFNFFTSELKKTVKLPVTLSD